MKTEIQVFEQTAQADGNGLIPVKPLCDFFGLDWRSQQRSINNNELLNSKIIKNEATGVDGKNYNMLCFDKRSFIIWVTSINSNSVNSNFKQIFLDYQNDIFDFIFGEYNRIEQMRIDYKRREELNQIILDAKKELNQIDSRTRRFIKDTYGQLSLNLINS
jgi:hypothetical protein